MEWAFKQKGIQYLVLTDEEQQLYGYVFTEEMLSRNILVEYSTPDPDALIGNLFENVEENEEEDMDEGHYVEAETEIESTIRVVGYDDDTTYEYHLYYSQEVLDNPIVLYRMLLDIMDLVKECPLAQLQVVLTGLFRGMSRSDEFSPRSSDGRQLRKHSYQMVQDTFKAVRTAFAGKKANEN